MMKTIAQNLLYINCAWYIVLTIAFMLAGEVPKMLYFFGAAILTAGIVLM